MNQRFDLSERRAVVTGGARGLGLGMAIGLAQAGAEVWALDIIEDRFPEARAAADDAGVTIEFHRCDVTNQDDVDSVAAACDDGTQLVLLNNAGIGERSSMENLSYEEWSKVLDVNLYGGFICARAFGAIMLRQGRGSIINIASVYGFLAPDNRLYTSNTEGPLAPAYGASKGGVLSLNRSLAAAWSRRGIRVNSISPGMFLTEQTTDIIDEDSKTRILERTPMARFGEAEDLVGAAIFLASDSSSFVTGHNLVVDGGWSIW